MKTILNVIMCIFLFLFITATCGADDFTFRKTKWGMSISEVKSSEPLQVAKEDENLLGYRTTVIGKDVFLLYFFIENKLTRTMYALAESHTNKNDFIGDYNNFKEIIFKKYGKPDQDETIWKNDTYKNDYSRWGTAISLGQLVFFSSWKTKDTEITNMLRGENFDVSCIVEYSSIDLKSIEKEAHEKKALDSF